MLSSDKPEIIIIIIDSLFSKFPFDPQKNVQFVSSERKREMSVNV
jgi:hypothetical protein